MGGDRGPHIALDAAIMAVQRYTNLTLILCGEQSLIEQHLARHHLLNNPQLLIAPASQVVEMDEKPSIALRSKKDSSMRVAINLVEQQKAQACVSAGNTGALFGIAHYVLKTLPCVERPALISALPTHDDSKHVFMLDLGANVFCDSTVLYQFGLMGAVMAEVVDGIESPRVALLNMGEEEVKGSDHIKQAAALLNQHPAINYVGFIEGNNIFTNKADVIVCDGFVGNVALKTSEGIARLVYQKTKSLFKNSLSARILAKILMPGLKKMYKSLNPDQYNGASLIGLRGIVVKSHGNATTTAFFNAIVEAINEIERQVPEKIRMKVEQGLLQRP
jgi:glycerol-3-phosphate acyltransferase PlsX